MCQGAPDSLPSSQRTPVVILLGVLATFLAFALLWSRTDRWKIRIGATVDVIEVSSGLVFKARVDTGAALPSIHCEAIEIEDESPLPKENVGKLARLLLANEQDEQNWIDTAIADYAPIRTVDAAKPRYYARLTLKCRGVEKETLVTLDDRSHMKHRLLLGRAFLKDDFVVDVSKDDQDFR